MAKKLVVGQIGCGVFAMHQYGSNIRRNQQTRIKWACDVSGSNAKAYLGFNKKAGHIQMTV